MRPSWQDYLLGLAVCVSKRSPDSQTQHGAVLVSQDHRILATGYNGFPRGLKDDSVLPTTRPEKYPWMIHSEVNAMASANGPLDGATAYVTGPPCFNCLLLMWQNGIKTVVHIDGYGWAKDEKEEALKKEFLLQSGMSVTKVKPNLSWLEDAHDY